MSTDRASALAGAARGLGRGRAGPSTPSMSVQDCFNRPLASPPDAWMDVLERTPIANQK